jgi:hypothetical protein
MSDSDDDFSGLGPFRSAWADRFLAMAAARVKVGGFLLLCGVLSALSASILLYRHGLPMGDGAAALTVLSPLLCAAGGLLLSSTRLLKKKADREIVRSIMQR